ncbi:MAG TPA: selenoprotein [Acidobacteria bacterium]|uniref:Selenoprotein n=1 Tax=marine metagenome TaxID=408172 RepID=A0A381TC27_9ZZZZ|nr:selenoprotein [Acidobacteriota bacterium]
MPKATSLAASLKEALGVEADVLVGDRGQFDVVANGALIFSKQTEERFPESDEIIDALRSLDVSTA